MTVILFCLSLRCSEFYLGQTYYNENRYFDIKIQHKNSDTYKSDLATDAVNTVPIARHEHGTPKTYSQLIHHHEYLETFPDI